MKLLIINDFGIIGGGTENRISTLVDYFMKNRIFEEIHVMQQKNNIKKKIKRKTTNHTGIKIHFCPKGYLQSYLFTKKIIKKHKIDLVQAHNMMGLTPMPVLAAKKLSKPVIWYAHDYWAMCTLRNFINPYNAMKDKLCGKAYGKKCTKCRANLRSRLKLWLWKNMLNKTDFAIATGRTMISLYEHERILKKRWKVVVPWIDPVMLEKVRKHEKTAKRIIKGKSRKRDKTILFVGSLLDFKGAWVAVKALKHIIQEVPDARLVFIGSEQESGSVYRRRIEAIARQDNTLGAIKFLGKKDRKDIKGHLGKAGVYVCPTVCIESFGLNWAEAMASGCPIVASSIGSIPEHINNEIDNRDCNGLLFEPRNHKQLAEKVIYLLKNKQLSNSIGKKAEAYAVQNFDLEIRGKEIITLYKSMYKNITGRKWN